MILTRQKTASSITALDAVFFEVILFRLFSWDDK